MTWGAPFDDVPPPRGPDDYGLSSNARGDPAPSRLSVIKASDLLSRPLPTRSWLVAEAIPHNAVTLLYGDGGVGKSLLALQLCCAVATGTSWLGMSVQRGRPLYLSAEDDAEEIHLRLEDLRRLQDVEPDSLADLLVLPMVDSDPTLAIGGSTGVAPTLIYRQLVSLVEQLSPTVVVLDSLADVFSGNENDRSLAKGFIRLLTQLAKTRRCAIIVLAHPSLTGISSGSGRSGSTAWSNSVRSRLYLRDPEKEDDPDFRTLKIAKLNYGKAGRIFNLRRRAGGFDLLSKSTGASDKTAADAKADRVFLSLLTRFNAQGNTVSPKRSQSFAPTVFEKQPDADGCKRDALELAMNRLIASRKIETTQAGPPSRRYTYLRVCQS